MSKDIKNIYDEMMNKKTKDSVNAFFNKIIETEKKDNSIGFSFMIEELSIPMNCYAEKDEIHFKKSSLDNIQFTYDYNGNNIHILIKNLYHEIRHVIQKNKADNGILEDSAFFYITCNLINDYYDIEEYKRNYIFEEIEIDANIYAYNKLLELVDIDNELKKQTNNEININMILLLLQQRIDKKNNTISTYDHIPNILNIVLEKNHSLIELYPGLKVFYKENGQDKTIYELLENIEVIINSYKMCPIFYTQMLTNKLLSVELERINKEYIELLKTYLNIYLNNFKKIKNIPNKFIKNYYSQLCIKLRKIIDFILLNNNDKELLKINEELSRM